MSESLSDIVVEVLAGLAAGVFAGVTGAGGGLLMVPILVWLGIPPVAAAGTSNIAITLTAISGSVINTVKYKIPWKRVATLSVGAVACAPLGVLVARLLSPTALLVAFAVFNVSAILLLQRKVPPKRSAPPAADDSDSDERDPGTVTEMNGESWWKIGLIGCSGGVLAGLFGVGGGLILVPLQTVLLHTPIRLASRISLAVVLFASAASVITHVVSGTDLRWLTAFILAAGGLIGAPIGAKVLHHLTDRVSTRIIQVVLAIVAVSFIIRL